jgi:hypothetical protein
VNGWAPLGGMYRDCLDLHRIWSVTDHFRVRSDRDGQELPRGLAPDRTGCDRAALMSRAVAVVVIRVVEPVFRAKE